MKKLITVLFIIVSINVYSQKTNFIYPDGNTNNYDFFLKKNEILGFVFSNYRLYKWTGSDTLIYVDKLINYLLNCNSDYINKYDSILRLKNENVVSVINDTNYVKKYFYGLKIYKNQIIKFSSNNYSMEDTSMFKFNYNSDGYIQGLPTWKFEYANVFNDIVWINPKIVADRYDDNGRIKYVNEIKNAVTTIPDSLYYENRIVTDILFKNYLFINNDQGIPLFGKLNELLFMYNDNILKTLKLYSEYIFNNENKKKYIIIENKTGKIINY